VVSDFQESLNRNYGSSTSDHNHDHDHGDDGSRGCGHDHGDFGSNNVHESSKSAQIRYVMAMSVTGHG
jgi:hypothetical protein